MDVTITLPGAQRLTEYHVAGVIATDERFRIEEQISEYEVSRQQRPQRGPDDSLL